MSASYGPVDGLSIGVCGSEYDDTVWLTLWDHDDGSDATYEMWRDDFRIIGQMLLDAGEEID